MWWAFLERRGKRKEQSYFGKGEEVAGTHPIGSEKKRRSGMGGHAETQGWARGCEKPTRSGPHEVNYMGRSMLVHIRETGGPEKYVVCGVPGHLGEELPVGFFEMYVNPRSRENHRSATSNLGEYARAVSRVIAGITALHAGLHKMGEMEYQTLVSELGYGVNALKEKIGGLYLSVGDREGVEKAVRERLQVWGVEDHEAIPLPSEGLGAPEEGNDVNGRNI